jgi:hypothetical protein
MKQAFTQKELNVIKQRSYDEGKRHGVFVTSTIFTIAILTYLFLD